MQYLGYSTDMNYAIGDTVLFTHEGELDTIRVVHVLLSSGLTLEISTDMEDPGELHSCLRRDCYECQEQYRNRQQEKINKYAVMYRDVIECEVKL